MVRAGVRRVAVVAVVVALVLFALPLAFVTHSLLQERELAELEILARSATTRVGGAAAGDPVELPPAEPPTRVGVYEPSGVRRSGAGPAQGGVMVRRAATGVTATGWDRGEWSAAVPVVNNERVIAVVRAGEPAGELWRQVGAAWGLEAAAALVAWVAALGVARRQSRALVEPLEQLASVASRVSEGDLTARATPSSVPEVDLVGQAHNAMVRELTQALEGERRFSAQASHQLRTPLARMRLELEAAMSAPNPDARLQAVLQELGSLQSTIDDVLLVARRTPGLAGATLPVLPLEHVVRGVARRWHGPLAAVGRRLSLHVPDRAEEPGQPLVAGRIVGQVLEVLLDNAMRHGRGEVQVVIRETAGVPAVDVVDEGTLAAKDPFAVRPEVEVGLGLPLARTMAEALGGRLTVTNTSPTTFTLFLPDRAEPLSSEAAR
ncbi:HAMP domain-containing sensor histidine kinase [Phycicoccus ginsengisoli]